MASFSYFATGVRRMAHAALRGLYLALVQRCERHSALNSVLPELIYARTDHWLGLVAFLLFATTR